MESTGVYWRPVYQMLEGRFELLLVNAQPIKTVPGRKTDVRMASGSRGYWSMAGSGRVSCRRRPSANCAS